LEITTFIAGFIRCAIPSMPSTVPGTASMLVTGRRMEDGMLFRYALEARIERAIA